MLIEILDLGNVPEHPTFLNVSWAFLVLEKLTTVENSNEKVYMIFELKGFTCVKLFPRAQKNLNDW
jgi:hypothetical protein